MIEYLLKLKKACNDMILGRVTECGEYDYEEWSNYVLYICKQLDSYISEKGDA